MRAIIALALGIALAVVGSLAVAGSSYTPPAASGGVEGDGTGVTDASAFRTALGLGTAATLTAGTSANNAVQLDGTGKLPAVDGSALTNVSAAIPSASAVPYTPADGADWSNPDPTQVAAGLDAIAARMVDAETITTDPEVSSLADLEWSSGTQIPAYLGSGTSSLLTVGSGALNLVQLDGDSKLPAVDGSLLTNVSASPYAADSWDLLDWTAGAGTMVSDGWTSFTHASSSLTDESATEGGIACRKLTPGAAQYAGVYYTAIPATGKWEVRLRIKVTTSGSSTSSPWYGWSVSGPSSGGLVRRMGIGLAPTDTVTSGVWYWGGSSLGNTTAMISTLADQWIDWTVRVHDGRADGTGANAYYELWAGQLKLLSGYTQTTGGAVAVPWISQSGVARAVYVGKINGTSGTAPIYVASVQVRTGWNEAPPDYTFRSFNGGVGP